MIWPAADISRPSEDEPLYSSQQHEGGRIIRFGQQVPFDLPAVLWEPAMVDAEESLATRLAKLAALRTHNLALDGGQRSRLSLEKEAQ